MVSLALYGSGEFLAWSREVDQWCLDRATATGDRVLILPTASAPEGDAAFAKWSRMGFEHYEEQGLRPEVLDLRTRADAERVDLAAAVEGARLLFFSGGNPGYLAETLTGTRFWRAVLAAVADGTAIAGCSAGACILGTIVPFIEGEGITRWVDGMRLLDLAYVAPHFDVLDSYQPGLRARVVGKRPDGSVVVGLDEETALCGDGETWDVRGNGGVWIGRDEHDLVEHRAGAQPVVQLGLNLP